MISKALLLTVGLFLIFTNMDAHHIVGGEIYLKSKGNYVYELGLHFYFNNNQTELATEYSPLVLTIFRKRDNKVMGNYYISKKIEQNITYNNTNCARATDISTRYFLYSGDVTLSPSVFNDSQGYYVVWTSCFRNDAIKNIANPSQSCMVWYTEFPAVTANGVDLVDSTPEFAEITGDYACINQAFSFDFSGTDADGDSLVYSLVDPLTYSGTFTPPQNGQTTNVSALYYHSITWATGYSLSHIIDGSSPMEINSQTGVITFTASQLGLYAFSVRCREFRKGVQIGSVQRDFQLEVLNCESNNAPLLKLYQSGAAISNNASINLASSDSHCFQLKASDKISGTSATSSTLTMQVNAANIAASDYSVTPTSGTITSDNDTLKIAVCFKDCFSTKNGEPERISFILADNGCPNGLRDTVSIYLTVKPPSSVAPTIMTDLPGDSASLKIGNKIDFNVLATQSDGGTLAVTAVGRDFNLTDVGMNFSNQTGLGSLTIPFDWTLACNAFSQHPGDKFIVDFIASNNNTCLPLTDTVTVQLHAKDTVYNYNEFNPYNVFTPNGDEYNETYEIPDLPPDNCINSFQRITIINRWGQTVFESKTRDFSWSGKDYPVGTYFYLIQYSNKKYKGWLSLLR